MLKVSHSVQKVAPNLGLKIVEKPIKSTADVDRALSLVSRDNTDGIFVICSGIFRDSFKKIAAVAIQKRLALTGCGLRHVTELGALLSYGADSYRIGHRGAWYVDRILKGTKPKDLPVEAPTYFEFVINLKAAKQIGLTIPPNVLVRANKVIKVISILLTTRTTARREVCRYLKQVGCTPARHTSLS